MIGVAVVALLSTAVVLGAIITDWYVALPSGIRPTYVGRDTCARCHAEQVAAFTDSHHDRAMDLASPTTVLADFDDAVLEHDGMTTRFFRRGNDFWVETEGPDGEPAEYQVRYVFGVEPLQQYVVEMNRPADLPAGTISRAQVLRASWDTRENRWFHLRPPDVDERVMPSDPLHWTGSTQRWNTSCADCHSTDLQKNFDLTTLDYRTTFAEIDVSCEACHGPGSMHVELAEGGGFFWDRRYGYGLAKFTKEEPRVEIETCARCHSRRQVLDEETVAGQRLTDGMSCGLLTAGIYHADGQILGFAQYVDAEGDTIGNPGQGAPTLGFSWPAVPALNPFVLVEGEAPVGPDQVVMDKGTADNEGFGVGDTVSVATLLVTLPLLLLAITRKRWPLSARATVCNRNWDVVAPGTSAQLRPASTLRCQRSVGVGVPTTATLKLAERPTTEIRSLGWVLKLGNTGRALTVSKAELLVTLPRLLLTTTRKRLSLSPAAVPASA